MKLKNKAIGLLSSLFLIIFFGLFTVQQTFAYSFTDSFTATDNTPLSTYNFNYSKIDGPSTPYIVSNQLSDANDSGYWVATYPVNLSTINFCIDSANHLLVLGFNTSLGTVSGYSYNNGSSASSNAYLIIGPNTYTSTNTYDNSGTHRYCIYYDGSTVSLLRDNVSVISHSLPSVGTITSVKFGALNYTSYGWINPIITVDNLSIDDSPTPMPTPTPAAYSFSDSFNAPDNTPLSTYNSGYFQIDGSTAPYISSNQVTEHDGFWEETYPVNLYTGKVCVDSTNALNNLGFVTPIASIYGYSLSSSGSSHANLTIGSNNYSSTDIFDNSGTHTYCVEYDGSTASLLRDNISVVSHPISSIGTITHVEFGSYNYTSYGWTNPVVTVDNLSIEGLSFSIPTPTPTSTPTPTPTNTPTPTPANVAPVVGAISASVNPVQVGTETNATANFTDGNAADTHTAVFDWGDGLTSSGTVTENNGSGSVSGNHIYLAAGVYEVRLIVTDNNNASDSEIFQYFSVYNPTPQGLFTGVRIFQSPAGAYLANSNLTGQVRFGVTAKYQGTGINGDVSMNFNAANFEFNATSLTVLVTANNKATLRGTGTVNGSGSYTFMVTGLDGGSGDDFVRFQIKDSSNNVVYDSQPGAADTIDPTTFVTAGQIIVH